MTVPTLNVLVFEDNPADVIFLREALEQDALNTFALTVVERLSEGLPQLAAHPYAVVLLDLGLPDSRGLATFERVQHVAPDVPIVIFSGNTDEQDAIRAVRAGAQEYMVKGPAGFAMTSRAIRHAIERQNLHRSLQASERRFATAFHASPTAQSITALDSQQLVDVNEAYCRLTGYACSELIGHTTGELKLWADPADRQTMVQHWQLHGRVRDVELNLRTYSGEIRTLLVSLEPIELNGRPCVISTAVDITDRKRAEEKLAESERFSNATLNGLSAHICVIDAEGRLLFVNQAWREFAEANPPVPVNYGLGSNYLAVCDSATDSNACAREFAQGIRAVINGQCETYALEYPCHSPEQQRWFVGRVTRFPGEGPRRLVISHENITERKLAEEALAQASNTLAEAQKIAHLGSFEYIAATQTTVWSEEEYHIYGLDPAGPSPAYDVMLQQCFAPDDAALLNETFTNAMRSRSIYELEHRLVRPDGSMRWVYDRALPYFDEYGELVRYIGSTLDITERKRAEAAIRQWADAFEHCAHGIALGDPVTNRVLACNPAFARLHRCAVQDITGQLSLSVYAPDDRDHVQASLAEADRLGQIQYEARMLRRDGSTFPVQMDVVSVRDTDGRLLYRVATAQDITERLKADRALRQSETKFRSYIQSSPIAIFIINATGRYRDVNRAAQDLLGYDFKTLSDLTLPELIADEDFEVAMQGFVELQTNKVMVAELRLKRRTGELVWVMLRAVRLNDDTYLAFCADITDRKQAEAELAQLNAQLEERVSRRTLELAVANERLTELDRLKSKFVSDVTHELRTPITSLILSLELLERGKPEKYADYLSRAIQQGLRMKTLIEDILDVSRLDRDLADLALAPLDLNALLYQVVTAQQARAEAAGLALAFEPAVDLPITRGDLNRLSQVATNLIANALNYTSTGAVRVRSLCVAERLGFEVRDTGMGIAPEDLPHLFQRFYRGQRASQSSVRGTGLGLSIVKEIVEAHGGTVEVESQVGVGSTFRVWLPVGVNDPL